MLCTADDGGGNALLAAVFAWAMMRNMSHVCESDRHVRTGTGQINKTISTL